MNFLDKIRLKFGRKDILEYQQTLINTHFEEVENMYQDMRKWRHNYRNHLQILKAYSENNDLESIKNYLNELENDLHSIAPVIRTGNKMTDAIVNSKVSIAKGKNINVIVDVNISKIVDIKEVDLTTIIGNLFDNAIEASMDLPREDRYIRLYMDMKGKKLYISFTNLTKLKKQDKFGNLFKSTKGINRGLGLISIDEIIEKYNGYISRNSEDNAFTTEILI
ncbi:GHKL domain-containing protein [Helcococcus ovis]|uniref:GHKL domain-containing protein n=1 Tax=Helcococcus ovis TaxID=72026 RepID=A0A4R9C1F4_9FIRM|nr:GHKL domain-containing protein [Helcococcus ovis]TFF65208.1 GHKL domain-containing protein [Helcococcus ovis]TFF65765.1 GHKL domain-containing protein [Helcococcus ovis]TFF68531.1 GHKL domain-containing protein [Helcococcus ovis]WNZ01410.1 GHKL domain-containing protein [Helcococcus ovis]